MVSEVSELAAPRRPVSPSPKARGNPGLVTEPARRGQRARPTVWARRTRYLWPRALGCRRWDQALSALGGDRPGERGRHPTAASVRWVLGSIPGVPEGSPCRTRVPGLGPSDGRPGSAAGIARYGRIRGTWGNWPRGRRSPGRQQQGQCPGAGGQGTQQHRARDPRARLPAGVAAEEAVRPASRLRVRVAQRRGQQPPGSFAGSPHSSEAGSAAATPGRPEPAAPAPGGAEAAQVAPRCCDRPGCCPRLTLSPGADPLHFAWGIWDNGLQGPELSSAHTR